MSTVTWYQPLLCPERAGLTFSSFAPPITSKPSPAGKHELYWSTLLMVHYRIPGSQSSNFPDDYLFPPSAPVPECEVAPKLIKISERGECVRVCVSLQREMCRNPVHSLRLCHPTCEKHLSLWFWFKEMSSSFHLTSLSKPQSFIG